MKQGKDLFKFSPLYTDLYQLAMGQAYFLDGTADQPAVFDYFSGSIPFGGGYVIFAGLEPLLQALETCIFLKKISITFRHWISVRIFLTT